MVPNLWVATPCGVYIDLHWGRHWSSDIKKIHAQLHIHNARSCLCQKLCSVKIDYVYIISHYMYIAISPVIQIWCMLYVFCISISGVAVLLEKMFGVVQCRRLGIAAFNSMQECLKVVDSSSVSNSV